MKTQIITTITALILLNGIVQSQVITTNADLYTLEGTKISTDKITNDSALNILVFWSTDSYKCREEILELNDLYVEELEDKNIRIIAVCTDNEGKSGAVRTFVSGHNIAFDVYIDKNSNFKRAMSIPVVPFTMVIDDETSSYNSYLGYTPSIDDLLSNKFKDFLALSGK